MCVCPHTRVSRSGFYNRVIVISYETATTKDSKCLQASKECSFSKEDST